VAFADSDGKSLSSMLTVSRLHESHEESSRIWADAKNLGVLETSAPEQQGSGALGAAQEAWNVLERGRRVVAPSVLATVGATHLPHAANRLPRSAERRVAAGSRSRDARGHHVVFIEDSAANLLSTRKIA